MLRYEVLFLTVPELTEDESKNIESQIDSIVSDANGKVLSYDRWGKFQLAYPIRKFDYGIYFLVRFNVSEENKAKLLEEIENYFMVRQLSLVMRHLVKHLDANASLEYKRPESLEDAPTGRSESFLKENKKSEFTDLSRADEDFEMENSEVNA